MCRSLERGRRGSQIAAPIAYATPARTIERAVADLVRVRERERQEAKRRSGREEVRDGARLDANVEKPREVAHPGYSLEPAAAASCREPGQRLVALHDAPLDRVLVGPVVNQVPGLVGDVARGLWGRLRAQHVHELQLERGQLLGRIAGSIRGRGSAVASFHIWVAMTSRLRSSIWSTPRRLPARGAPGGEALQHRQRVVRAAGRATSARASRSAGGRPSTSPCSRRARRAGPSGRRRPAPAARAAACAGTRTCAAPRGSRSPRSCRGRRRRPSRPRARRGSRPAACRRREHVLALVHVAAARRRRSGRRPRPSPRGRARGRPHRAVRGSLALALGDLARGQEGRGERDERGHR